MKLIEDILNWEGLQGPDGRPLYAYDHPKALQTELGELLRLRVDINASLPMTAAGFVFWAAEHFRSSFQGGHPTWAFVFDGLGLTEDRDKAVDLVKRGMAFWGRKVQRGDGGQNLFIYTLMAEGGVPEALLLQAGHYQQSMLGLIADIEAEGGRAAAPIAHRLAERRISDLPQAFRSWQFANVLAGLAMTLSELRASVPTDLPVEATEAWLNTHRPGWSEDLPLRMSEQVRQQLIRPALSAEREPVRIQSTPLVRRELRRSADGWRPYVSLAPDGFLLAAQLPGLEELRLRLTPIGTLAARRIVYSATPAAGGWTLRAYGASRDVSESSPLWEPIALQAHADGHLRGDIILEEALPLPSEAVTLWRPASGETGESPTQLLPLPGSGRTSAASVWALAQDDQEPAAEDGIDFEGPFDAPGGSLWKLTGAGSVTFGTQQLKIQTQAESDDQDARLIALGAVMPQWRLHDGSPLYRGRPILLGVIGAGTPIKLSSHNVSVQQGRGLGSEIVVWVEDDDPIARSRIVAIPDNASLTVNESPAGELIFTADGLWLGTRVRVSAGDTVVHADAPQGACRITLAPNGRPAGLVHLRLSLPDTGAALDLTTAYPARFGMLLTPDGDRLERTDRIDTGMLDGWRAVVPEGERGNLVFQLQDGPHQFPGVSMRVQNTVSLAPYRSLVRAMLALGGPDSSVQLRLEVAGTPTPRLDISRYSLGRRIDDDHLTVTMETGKPSADAALPPPGTIGFYHALDIGANVVAVRTWEDGPAIDLTRHLGDSSGPWILQGKLDGRQVRASIWSPTPMVGPRTREERVTAYAAELSELAEHPADDRWPLLIDQFQAAGEGGDAGVLDQVQALAQAPKALSILMLRYPRTALPDLFDLDAAAPISWQSLPVQSLVQAIQKHSANLAARLGEVESDAELIDQIVTGQLAGRFQEILLQRPDLAGHLAAAAHQTGLLMKVITKPCGPLLMAPLAKPIERFEGLCNEVVKSDPWLPTGIVSVRPMAWPLRQRFNHHMQQLFEAPIAAAEMAAGQRPSPTKREIHSLLTLRLAMPSFFDAALPFAVAHIIQEADNV